MIAGQEFWWPPRIFAALTSQGLHLSEFRTHPATLEDVFVGLTGRNLRDE